ncbi:MAG: DUF4363 family protein [Clostridia bacterium]|nr:DUF4363 family protein [Clostridia bacterium]
MKDVAIFIVTLMVIIAVGMWQVNYLEETSRYLKTDLKYVEYFLKMEKYHDAGDSLKNVKNSWDSMEDTWAIFIHHDDIEKVEVGMSEIASYIESEEKEEAIAKIESIISNIEYTVECEKICIKNIF